YPYLRPEILTLIASNLTNELKIQALNLVREYSDEDLRSSALAAVAPYLTDDERKFALHIANDIENEHDHSDALIALVPFLNKEDKKQAMNSINIAISSNSVSALNFVMHKTTQLFEQDVKVLILQAALHEIEYRYKSFNTYLVELFRQWQTIDYEGL